MQTHNLDNSPSEMFVLHLTINETLDTWSSLYESYGQREIQFIVDSWKEASKEKGKNFFWRSIKKCMNRYL